MADPLILDAFTLFGPVPPRGAAQPGTDALVERMEKHGVAGAITTSTRGLYDATAAGNRETIARCQEAGGALQPAAILDPRLALGAQATTGARMLCVMPATQRWPLPFAPLDELLRTLAANGTKVPIFCEVTSVGDATRFRDAFAASGWADTAILFGSCAGDALLETIAVAQSNPNISLVTNGVRGIGAIEMAVGALGANRVVFGSGAPARSLGAALALIRRSELTAADQELVLGGNAKRILSAGGAAA